MDGNYRHTQFGVLTVALFILIGLLLTPLVVSLFADGSLVSALVIIGLFLLFLLMFYSLTIEISAGKLNYWFGIGLIRRSTPLADIQRTAVVKSPWYYFWGIKSIPDGWLYAVAPGKAVEIIFNDDKMIRLGTNEPRLLKEAVDAAMGI